MPGRKVGALLAVALAAATWAAVAALSASVLRAEVQPTRPAVEHYPTLPPDPLCPRCPQTGPLTGWFNLATGRPDRAVVVAPVVTHGMGHVVLEP